MTRLWGGSLYMAEISCSMLSGHGNTNALSTTAVSVHL